MDLEAIENSRFWQFWLYVTTMAVLSMRTGMYTLVVGGLVSVALSFYRADPVRANLFLHDMTIYLTLIMLLLLGFCI